MAAALSRQWECSHDHMTSAIAEKNKAIVLEAFDTLFNQRDYIGAEKFWSPEYIQHRLRQPAADRAGPVPARPPAL
jgi:hypothetical protein